MKMLDGRLIDHLAYPTFSLHQSLYLRRPCSDGLRFGLLHGRGAWRDVPRSRRGSFPHESENYASVTSLFSILLRFSIPFLSPVLRESSAYRAFALTVSPV